jgi:hypothetical protein
VPNTRRFRGPLSIEILVGLVMVVIGCGQAGPAPTGVIDLPSASTDAVEGTDPALLALLDPAGRDLLTTIDPSESIEATIAVRDSDGVMRAARLAGFEATMYSIDEIMIVGPVRPVLAFVADLGPASVTVGEDERADRWIPVDRPVVVVPKPGQPYLAEPMEADLSGLAISADDQKLPMLRSVANAIETIDGRPYARLAVSGSCDPEPTGIVCNVSVAGSGIGAGTRIDEIRMRSDARTNWRGAIVDGTRGFQGVPRSLVRSAEWTARHDTAAANAIAAYRTCCGAQWDPAHPGQITLIYLRLCSNSLAAPTIELASTGDCFDSLLITVDIGSGTVVAVFERKGP